MSKVNYPALLSPADGRLRRQAEMSWDIRTLAAGIVLLVVATTSEGALGQQRDGIHRLYHFDSPASMSILEESGAVTAIPMMAVFNNLVLYDQHIPQNSLQSIVPDLATEWSWDQAGTGLTFKLRRGVEWHDGKPFTTADVKCTWDLLMGIGSEKMRVNPRKSWYQNLEEVTIRDDYEITFRLKRPQPAFIALLAAGVSPVYPCHVRAREMRQHPIGTGPFKFVEFKPDRELGIYLRPTRHDPSGFPADPGAAGCAERGPGGYLSNSAIKCQSQSHHQPDRAAFR
jgi:peptide/nickel transport system substrate-binding protein